MIRTSHLAFHSIVVSFALSFLVSTAAAQQAASSEPGLSGEAQSLDVQFAETYAQLAEARLRQAEALNQRVARSVSGEQMTSLRANYDMAQQLLRSAQQGEKGGRPGVFLRLAELAVAGAEADLASAKAANERVARTVSDYELNILELRARLARLDLEIGKRALAGPPEEDLRWKVGVLYEEVIRLRQEVNMLKQRN